MIQIKSVPDICLGEIYSVGKLVRMALIEKVKKDVYQQLHPVVTCKDFICDIYNASLEGKDIDFYGMNWDGSTLKPDYESLNLMLSFPSKDMKKKFLDNHKFLVALEKSNRLPESFIEDTNKDLVLALFADKFWISNTVILSFYLFLVRLMCSQEFKTASWVEEVDKTSIDGAMFYTVPQETINKVLDNLELLKFDSWCGFPNTVGERRIHHNSGFISIFGSHYEVDKDYVMKNSHYKEVKKRKLLTYYG